MSPAGGGVGGGENFSYMHYLSYMDANKSNLHHYNPHLQTFANKLRREMTKAEACLLEICFACGYDEWLHFSKAKAGA
jgi:hypothetical protein